MQESLQEHLVLFESLKNDERFLKGFADAAALIARALFGGKKVLVAGNGGSAADAQHFSAEFVATFKKESRKGYPVLALTTDTSFLTAWGNDFGFDDVFGRQVQAFGKEGDVLIAISTSGNSENIVRAAREAKKAGMKVVGLLGNEGGSAASLCDAAIVVPSTVTARIQEVHEFVLHSWCEAIVPNLQ